MRRDRVAFCLLAALAAASWAGGAEAWCRTTSNGDFVPTVAKPCDTGTYLRWVSKCVGFNMQKDASSQVDIATATTIANASLSAWSNVACPSDPVTCTGGASGAPSIVAKNLGTVACDEHECGGSHYINQIVFRDGGWPHADADRTLALTTITFSPSTGEIYDADIEVNSTGNKIGTADVTPKGSYDLLSILTHEAGHFYGLSHTQSANKTSTMYVEYKSGTSDMRSLEQDDVCGICAAYPPTRTATCNEAPIAIPVSVPVSGGCQCALNATGRSQRHSRWTAALVTMAALGAVRRRSCRRNGRPVT